MAWIPRIAAGAEVGGFRRAGDAEFGRVGLAEQHRAGTAIPADQPAVGVIDEVAVETAAAAPRPAGDGEAEILDQERNAPERPAREVRRGDRPGFVVGLV